MEHRLNSVQKEVIALERFFPHYMRERAERLFFALSVLFISFSVMFTIESGTRFGILWPIFQGLFLISFSLFLTTFMFELYFYSLRFRLEREHKMSFATLLVTALHHPKKKDLAKAFLHSRLGREVMERLGVSKESIHRFTLTKDPTDITFPVKGFLPDLAQHLHEQDSYFRDFLENSYVSKKHFTDAAEEVEKRHHKYLETRPFLSELFERYQGAILNINEATRNEICDIESFYKVVITEQATQLIISFFEKYLISYASSDERITFLTSLIEDALLEHGSRSHGASVIMPADVRRCLISYKTNI